VGCVAQSTLNSVLRMGLFRRRRPRSDEFEAPPGLEVPEGMVAIPPEQVAQMTATLVDTASDMAVARTAPNYATLAARVALLNFGGDDDGEKQGMHGGHQLAYNLFLLGYWCRVAEFDLVREPETSPDIEDFLFAMYERQTWGDDWFSTLCGASHLLAVRSPEDDGIADVHDALPIGVGHDFRRAFLAEAVESMTRAVESGFPGAMTFTTDDDRRTICGTGYWMRALSVSLPDEAHAEFASAGAAE
jgi:hypothetical protein